MVRKQHLSVKSLTSSNNSKHRNRLTNSKKHINNNNHRTTQVISTFNKHKKYEIFEATFIGHPEGAGGFLRPVNIKGHKNADILVDWKNSHSAIHGDVVQAEITGTTHSDRLKARIIEITSRNTNPIPAYLQKQAWGWRAVPLESRLSQIVSVPATELAQDGDIVTIVLNSNVLAKQIQGTVTSRLGRLTDLNIENKITAAIFNLRTEFPEPVMKELALFPTTISDDWLHDREDLRNTLIVTVDPPTAKDFDDAISVESLSTSEGDGWILGIHIADVSHYVNEGGALDQEAIRRGTSVYFPDQCIPMLPERLSGELCSLREGVDRLTITVWVTINSSFQVVATRFAKSVINSRKRLTYDQVKEACVDRSESVRKLLGTEVCQLLEKALEISRGLTKIRLTRGSLNLSSEETEFIFDANSRPVDARCYIHHDAHRMIEEFMLLANEAVARFFTDKKISTIYRIHDEPDPTKLEAFREVASTFGLISTHDELTPGRLNTILKNVYGKSLATTLNDLLIRSLKRAEYSADNIGHSGLALTDYLHFTSPIRRYPDLAVHRLLCKVIHKVKLSNDLHGHLAIVAKRCSHLEQVATEAERENHRWKTCLIMSNKVGDRFDGRIVGFSKKIVFIRLDNPFLEVSVPLSTVGSDFLVDQHNIKASSHDMNVVLSIGEKVSVEITNIDKDSRRVYASIAGSTSKNNKHTSGDATPIITAPIPTREVSFMYKKTTLRSKSNTKVTINSQKAIKTTKNSRKLPCKATTTRCPQNNDKSTKDKIIVNNARTPKKINNKKRRIKHKEA